MLGKVEYFVKRAIAVSFMVIVDLPAFWIVGMKRCIELYKEDPNYLLDKGLRKKNADRMVEDYHSNNKIGKLTLRLAEWADASYC